MTVGVPIFIQKAPRTPDGYVKGYGAPRLEKRVVKHLSTQELIELQEIQNRFNDLMKRRMAFLAKCGLDHRRPYKFLTTGEVIELGKWTPRY